MKSFSKAVHLQPDDLEVMGNATCSVDDNLIQNKLVNSPAIIVLLMAPFCSAKTAHQNFTLTHGPFK